MMLTGFWTVTVKLRPFVRIWPAEGVVIDALWASATTAREHRTKNDFIVSIVDG